MEVVVLTAPPPADEPLLTNLLSHAGRTVASAVSSAVSTMEIEKAAVLASEAAAREMAGGAIPPWKTLGEQFSILEPTLHHRCLEI
eukprot:6922030-Prymnesium_polylepis.1